LLMTTSSAILTTAAYHWLPWNPPPMPLISDRLIFTLRCNVFSVAFLCGLIGHIGKVRFFSAQRNPLSSTDKDRVEVYCRVLQNTVEQFIVSLVLQLISATWFTEAQMKFIPMIVVLFVVGRLIFLKGYLDPAFGHGKRAYGLPLTMQTSFVMLVYCLYRTMAEIL